MFEKITESKGRYYIYLFLSPWKVFLFLWTAVIISQESVSDYFGDFVSGFTYHDITVLQPTTIFSETTNNTVATEYTVSSVNKSIVYVLLVHMLASYVCYVFSKFACKIRIQPISFSLPMNLAVPLTITLITVFCALREGNVCYFHNFIPDYMAFNSPPIYYMTTYLINEYVWIWFIWIVSQSWITSHIWSPVNQKNDSTERLFVTPFYCSLLIDQCLPMNRRRELEADHMKREVINNEYIAT